jgi:hypothetical protein
MKYYYSSLSNTESERTVSVKYIKMFCYCDLNNDASEPGHRYRLNKIYIYLNCQLLYSLKHKKINLWSTLRALHILSSLNGQVLNVSNLSSSNI